MYLTVSPLCKALHDELSLEEKSVTVQSPITPFKVINDDGALELVATAVGLMRLFFMLVLVAHILSLPW